MNEDEKLIPIVCNNCKRIVCHEEAWLSPFSDILDKAKVEYCHMCGDKNETS